MAAALRLPSRRLRGSLQRRDCPGRRALHLWRDRGRGPWLGLLHWTLALRGGLRQALLRLVHSRSRRSWLRRSGLQRARRLWLGDAGLRWRPIAGQRRTATTIIAARRLIGRIHRLPPRNHMNNTPKKPHKRKLEPPNTFPLVGMLADFQRAAHDYSRSIRRNGVSPQRTCKANNGERVETNK